MNACRLCSCKTDLINIFHANLKNSRELRSFIVLATGIEIKETDIVSKFLCRRCCVLTIKIYKFRTKAVANDKALKEQCGQHYSPPLSPSLSALKASRNQNELGGTRNQIGSHHVNDTTSTTTTSGSNKIKRSSIRKHPSVDSVLKKHRNVKVPPRIFMSHINPVITLDQDEVKEWFDKHHSEGETVFLNELKKLSQITIRKVPSISNKEKYEILSNYHNKRPCVTTSVSTEKNGTAQSKEIEREPISDNARVSNYPSFLIPGKPNGKFPQVNVAKKRTGRPSGKKVEKRKNTHSGSDSSDDELMPVPKKRSLVGPPRSNLQKIHLPSEKAASKEFRKKIFTSSLELTPPRREETPSNKYELPSPVKNIMYSVREANLFICNVCNQIYDTKKKLSDHQRSHLHCKFCKEKMKNIDALFEHLNEACFINLTKNLPNIVLTRVDEDAEIVNRFSDTFKRFKNDSYACKIDDSSDSDMFEDYDDDNCGINHIEEINVPMASSNLIEETEVTPLIQTRTSKTLTDTHPKATTETEFKNQTLVEALLGQSSNEEEGETLLEQYITREINKAAEQRNNRKGNSKSLHKESADDNIVCISDESDNETNTTKNKTKTKVPAGNKDFTPMESVRPEIKLAQQTILNLTEVTPPIQTYTSETLTDVHPKDSTETEFKSQTLVEALLSRSSNEEQGETLLEQYITKEINKAAEQQNNRKGNSKSSQERSPDNVVCISDESDNETNTTKNKTKTKVPVANKDFTPIESVSIIHPEIRLVQKTIPNPPSTQTINNEKLIHVEEDIIKNLFKRHKISNQINKYTQMFSPCDSSIKTLGNKLMSIENVFFELSIHKVPVELEYCNKIKINFQKISEKQQSDNNFNWEKFEVNQLDQNPGNSPAVEVIQIEDDDPPSAHNKQVSSGNSTGIPSKNSSASNNGTEILKDKNIANSRPSLLLNSSSFISTARTTISSNQSSIPLVPNTSTSKTNTPSENVQTTSSSGLQLTTNPTRSQFTPPLVISHSQSTPSNPGTILLNHASSSNGLLSAQKLLSFPSSMLCSVNSPPSTAHTQNVQPSRVPPITNTSINNFSKIVPTAPTGSLNQNSFSNLQTVTTTAAATANENQVRISEIEKQSTTSKNSKQTSSSESPVTEQSLLRVKDLWELSEPKL